MSEEVQNGDQHGVKAKTDAGANEERRCKRIWAQKKEIADINMKMKKD
jgi:hypothetical protein